MTAIERYAAAVDRHGLFASSRNLLFYMRYIFDDVALQGARMLDIGGGIGLCSFYAAACGASRVVCLEPEAAGSTHGVGQQFARLGLELRLPQVTGRASTFQEFEATGEAFDVILMHDSINHLDEPACVALRRDPAAARTYAALFERLAALGAAGCKLVITDASSSNFFASLGLRNPIQPTIEWEKHQPPEVWARMLTEASFGNPRIRWTSFNRLGSAGRVLLGHKLPAYFLDSRFCLTMEKRSQ